MTIRFQDRHVAGKHLANALKAYANRPNTFVLALPRGGLPVAYEVSKTLQLPLDICLVRKLGLPGHPELAMGAIASGGVRVFNYELINSLQIPETLIEHVAMLELRELKRRDRTYRGHRLPHNLTGSRIILIDDGIATGATIRAAIEVLKSQQPEEIIVAAPVAPVATCQDLEKKVDRVICLSTPSPFHAIGLWYESFPQITDDEVNRLLEMATAKPAETEPAETVSF